MKRVARIVVMAVSGVLALATSGGDTRSVAPVRVTPAEPRPGFDPAASVALFVGVRSFGEDETLQNVPYAVDDAVDLAYIFALDPRVGLVRADRVALALSDQRPRKESSQRRLAELKRRGATVASASQSQILKLLNRQAALATENGIFIVSFATHGFSVDGAQHLLAASSLFREPHTAIPAARVFDLVAASAATRSLVLIDTCRERVRKQRSTTPEPLSAAPLIERMRSTVGQVVLYGAAAGKWAFDDDIRRNGVFTGAVLDVLQCRAGRDRSGVVSVNELSEAVERNVLTWIRTNRDPMIRNATQASIDGAARSMPLAICSRQVPPEPPAVPQASAPAVAPRPAASRTSLRPVLAQCRTDGETLLHLYGSPPPEHFVSSYLRWRDGCVAVLRDLDERLPATRHPSETARFLAVASSWCATQCPAALSPGRCGLFRETPRAERCFWDLDKAVKHIDDVLLRNLSSIEGRKSQ